MRNIDHLIAGYNQWLEENVENHWSLWHIVVTFKKCAYAVPKAEMQSWMESVLLNQFYSVLCRQVEWHPGRASRANRLPKGFICFDLPGGISKGGLFREAHLNYGLHLDGILAFPPKHKIEHLDMGRHIREEQCRYTSGDIYDVNCELIKLTREDRHRVADYATKSVKYRGIDEASTIFLPRAYSEVRPNKIEQNPNRRAFKRLSSSSNYSDETVKDLLPESKSQIDRLIFG